MNWANSEVCAFDMPRGGHVVVDPFARVLCLRQKIESYL